MIVGPAVALRQNRDCTQNCGIFFLIALAFTNIAPIITSIELIPALNQYEVEYLDDPAYSDAKDEVQKIMNYAIVVIVFGIIAFISFLTTLIYAFKNREEKSNKKTQNRTGIYITLLYLLVWFYVIGVLASNSKLRNDIGWAADAYYSFQSFYCTGDQQIICDYVFAMNRWFNALMSLAIVYPICALVFTILICYYHRPHVQKVNVISMVQQPQLFIAGVGNAYYPNNPQFQNPYQQNPYPYQPQGYNNQIVQGQPLYGAMPNNFNPQNASHMPMNSNQNQSYI